MGNPSQAGDISLEPLLNRSAIGSGESRRINFSPIATTVVSGTKTITTAGTAEALAASATPCSQVVINADLGNSGDPVMVVGDSSCSATAGSMEGIILVPGNNPVTIFIDDLSKLYADAQTNGNKICYTYFV